MPLPKVPQRGDAARLEQLASGLKLEHGTYGAVVQRNEVGRPSSQGGPTQRAPQSDAGVAPEHQQAYDLTARAEWVRQYWQMMAQLFPGPRTEYALARAELLADKTAQETYTATPNFED